MKSQPKPQQLEVPGFGTYFKDCKRDHARLKGERSGRPLPLFDSLSNTPDTDSAPLSLPSGRLSENGEGPLDA